MNSGATAERVYGALRYRLLNHEFRPGDRLDPAVLAEPLAASVTPVRDALHMLVGETLVETRSGTGFYVPMLDEPLLKDLYAWSAELVGLALRGAAAGPAASPVRHATAATTTAERTADLFRAIACLSRNGEHLRAIERLSARLNAVRTVEGNVISAIDDDLQAFEAALVHGDRAALRRLNTLYHRRRLRAAAAIVRATYRTGTAPAAG